MRKKPLATLRIRNSMTSIDPSEELNRRGTSGDLSSHRNLQSAISTGPLSPRARFSLLGPIPRKTKVNPIRSVRSKPTTREVQHRKSAPNLQKGFKLLRTLFGLKGEEDSSRGLAREKEKSEPKKLTVPQIKLHKVPIIPCLQKPREDSPLLPVLDQGVVSQSSDENLDQLLEFDFKTPRRRPSFMVRRENLQVPQVVETMQQTRKEILITPVVKLQAIEDSELTSESSEDDEDEEDSRIGSRSSCMKLQRRFSMLAKEPSSLFTRRPTQLLVADISEENRRFSVYAEPFRRNELKNELVTEYKIKTAEMLSDTHFRMKGFKMQRIMPQRLFKHC